MTPDLTALLEAFDAKRRAATPGPYSYSEDENEVHSDSMQQSDGDPVHICEPLGPPPRYLANGAYIAALDPDTVGALIDCVRILKGLTAYCPAGCTCPPCAALARLATRLGGGK